MGLLILNLYVFLRTTCGRSRLNPCQTRAATGVTHSVDSELKDGIVLSIERTIGLGAAQEFDFPEEAVKVKVSQAVRLTC